MFLAAGFLLAEASASRTISLEAGVVLLGWIGLQFSMIGLRHWLQPLMGVLGGVLIVLSFLLPAPG